MTFTTHTNAPAMIKENCSEFKINSMKHKRYTILKELGFVDNEILFIGSGKNTTVAIQTKAELHNLPTNSADVELFYFDIDGKYIVFNTTNNALKELMKHNKSGSDMVNAKANTHNTTLLKELISKEVFEKQESTEADIIKMVKTNYNHLLKLYNYEYYTSAISQLEVFKTLEINVDDYIFELQMGEINKAFYDKVKRLAKIHKDNWNPADLWLIKKSALDRINKGIKVTKTLEELNSFIRHLVKDKVLYPISLKHVENGNAKLSLNNMGEEYTSDYTFNIKSFNVSKSFKSIFVMTDSDYQFKLNMRASADCINLNKEGKIKNKNASEGALGSNLWNYYVTNNPTDHLANGSKTPYLTKEIHKEKQKIFVKYKNIISNDIHLVEFEDLDIITGRRYQIIADHIEYIMTHQDLVEFSYFASKKLYDGAGAFYLISE